MIADVGDELHRTDRDRRQEAAGIGREDRRPQVLAGFSLGPKERTGAGDEEARALEPQLDAVGLSAANLGIDDIARPSLNDHHLALGEILIAAFANAVRERSRDFVGDSDRALGLVRFTRSVRFFHGAYPEE
jgi:hypothetical protein